MANFKGWELILLVLLALLLFGGFKKLPDAARGIGRSLRIFKAETKGLVEDEPEQAAVPAAGTTEAVAAAATEQPTKIETAKLETS